MAVRACEAAGFTPRVRHYADDFATVLALVAAGQGVALVPELGASAPPPDVSLTAPPARRRTRIAYRRGARGRPVVAAGVAALHAAGRRPPAADPQQSIGVDLYKRRLLISGPVRPCAPKPEEPL